MNNGRGIIDGINVSECEYLQYKGCEFEQCLIKMASFDLKCEGYNCYFKQLKRKEQECDSYKQALNEIKEIAKHNNFLVRDPFCGTGYRDLSGQILNIINKIKENMND